MPQSESKAVVYIPVPGSPYDAQDIDAEILRDVLKNHVLADQIDKVIPQIFSGMYSLTLRDQAGEENEDVSGRLRAMVETPSVQMWSRMKQCWIDVHAWGPCLMYADWSRPRGSAETVLAEMSRLDPYSFRNPPPGAKKMYSPILQGITLNEAGELELWQTQAEDAKPVKVDNTYLLKDSASTELAGSSKILPLIPIVRMYNECWDAQNQKVYRVASPIMFIKVKDPQEGDEEYAQTIMRNWGRNTAFQLRENMEFVEMTIHDEETALDTLDKLEGIIKAHFYAGSNVQRQGATIGGNAAAEKETSDEWIMGQRTMIEDLFEFLLQPYLDRNGYAGWSIEIRIDARPQNPGELELKQAELGYRTRTLSPNEVRRRLGEQDVDDEKLAEIAAQWDLITPAAPSSPWDAPLGEVERRAAIVEKVANADPMDPERYMSFQEQVDFLKGKKAAQ